MTETKPKVLIIETVDSHALHPFFERFTESDTLEFKISLLEAIHLPRSVAEEEVAAHLRKNEYDLVLTPEIANLLQAIRAQHLGRVVAYGAFPLGNLNGYDDYFRMLDLDSDPYKQMIKFFGHQLSQRANI
jgi:hypothetical protein